MLARAASRNPVFWALLVACLAAGSLGHLHFINRVYLPMNHSDLLPCWSGTRAVLAGSDPWSGDIVLRLQQPYYAGAPQTVVRPEPQEFWYPAPVVVLMAPFTSLEWTKLRLIFLLVVPPLLALAVWLCLPGFRLQISVRARVVVLLIVLLSWPVVWGLRLQQLSVVVALAVFLAWALLYRGWQVVPGVLLALTTIKPQVAAPLLLWILVWSIARRKWRLIGALVASLALLLVASETMMPGWVPRWLAALGRYHAVTHATPELERVFGHWIGMAIAAAIVIAAAVSLWRLRRCEVHSPEFAAAAGLALAVAVLLSPMNPPIIYNYIFLTPAVLLIVFAPPADPSAAKLRVLLIAQVCFDILAAPVSALAETVLEPSAFWTVLPFLDFLLPVLATAILLLETWRMGRGNQGVPSTAMSGRAGTVSGRVQG
jgi:hypothetical protein